MRCTAPSTSIGCVIFAARQRIRPDSMKSRVSPVNEHSILILRQFDVKVRATENRVEREKILHIYVIEMKIFFLEDIIFICNIYDVF